MSQPPEVRIQINEHDNATPTSGQPHGQRQPEQSHLLGWMRNDNNALLVVATLVTTLTYQVGTTLPEGYYQDDNDGHRAGDSILRDKYPHRYWLFVLTSSGGFVNSIFMTLSLLAGVGVESLLIRGYFGFAYSCLVLTFIASQPTTKILLDSLLFGFAFLLWLAAINLEKYLGPVPSPLSALKGFVSRLFRR